MELTPGLGPLAAQARYSLWIAWGARLGLALLAASFAVYVLGAAPHVPMEELPRLWGRPAAELVAAAGIPPGYGWMSLLPMSDFLVLAAVAVIASASIPCLVAVAPVFVARRERALAAICLAEVAVIAFAAIGEI